MAEGDSTNNDATAGGGAYEGGAEEQPTSGSEAAGADPAGSESSGIGDPQQSGGGAETRPGDWNPGEQSGSGGELY